MPEFIDALTKARQGMVLLWDELIELRVEKVKLQKQVKHLMSNHDDTKALLAEISADVDKLILAKGDSDAANADLKTDASALRDKVKLALGDSSQPAPVPVPVSVLNGQSSSTAETVVG